MCAVPVCAVCAVYAKCRGKAGPKREKVRGWLRGCEGKRVPFSGLRAARGGRVARCACNAGDAMRRLERRRGKASDPVRLDPAWLVANEPTTPTSWAGPGFAIQCGFAVCSVCVLDQISVRMRACSWLASLLLARPCGRIADLQDQPPSMDLP